MISVAKKSISKLYNRKVPAGCGMNLLSGEWKFQKEGMYTSTTDTFSNGFGRTQINRRVMNRLKNVEKRMKKIEAQFRENANYDYHFESDAYHE